MTRGLCKHQFRRFD